MRLLVTGREGQVVRALIEQARGTQFEIVPVGRPQLDLAGPQDAIIATIAAAAPELIVSAAGYTQVDRAEEEPELAFAVNEGGARAVARAAQRLDVPLIHLSTDYVFDGRSGDPYVESDPTSPATAYGASKLAGERAILAEHADSVILRTAWVYSPFGTNFVRTMLRLAAERDEISVVGDQLGNPTSALDIASGIVDIAGNVAHDHDPAKRGIFHMTSSEEASWADLAAQIFRLSGEFGGAVANVKPIASADYPTRAMRPANSRLNCDKLEEAHAVRLPSWRSSLRPVVQRLIGVGDEGSIRS